MYGGRGGGRGEGDAEWSNVRGEMERGERRRRGSAVLIRAQVVRSREVQSTFPPISRLPPWRSSAHKAHAAAVRVPLGFIPTRHRGPSRRRRPTTAPQGRPRTLPSSNQASQRADILRIRCAQPCVRDHSHSTNGFRTRWSSISDHHALSRSTHGIFSAHQAF